MSERSQFSRRKFLGASMLAGTGLMLETHLLWNRAFAKAMAGATGLAAPVAGEANPTVLENAKPGTTDWLLFAPAVDHQIEGYASATSVNRGEQISLYVHTTEPYYRLEIFRMGWYGGAGARRMTDPIQLTGIAQPMPTPDAVTGLIECRWTDPYVLTIPNNPADPTDWASGVYVAKLTAGISGTSSHIIFVVRDDARPAPFLFQSSVTTYQAYNPWGGKSLYDFNSTGGRALKVSFNRPYVDEFGSGQFMAFWAGWENNMVRFLEREGYDVTYCTNVDTHAHPGLLATHKAFFSVGHDEYWSWEMREQVEAALASGVHLGFFSANTCYWQIRFEPSPADGAANRTIVCYKDSYAQDPYYTDGNPDHQRLVTGLWRAHPVNRPEETLIGVQYDFWPVQSEDLVIENASHWIFEGTGLRDGDRLPGLVGYEADRMFGNSPAGTVRLAHSPVNIDGAFAGYSDMTIYTAPSGALVFATGTIQWSWGLDDFRGGIVHPLVVNPVAQQIMRNLLARLAIAPKVKADTATSLTSSDTPAIVGQAITFTAQVTSSAGVPGGTVEFFDGTASLGAASLSNGSASITTSALGAGSHSITAVYRGNDDFNSSTSPALTITLSSRADTATSLESSNNYSNEGQEVTFTAQVTSSAGVPSGSVQFFAGTTLLGTADVRDGYAALTTSTLAPGIYSMTAVYQGNEDFKGSTSPALTQGVNAGPGKLGTYLELTSSANPSVYRKTVTFTAVVKIFLSTKLKPTGKIAFKAGGILIGVKSLDSKGQAKLSISNLRLGSHTIQTSYSGDSNFWDSEATLTQVVAVEREDD